MPRLVEYWNWCYRDTLTGAPCRSVFRATAGDAYHLFPGAERVEDFALPVRCGISDLRQPYQRSLLLPRLVPNCSA